MAAIRDRFGSAFEVNLEAVPFANGIKSAPRRAEREAENVAVKPDRLVDIIHQQLRSKSPDA
jgi:hypothetical protein